MFFVLKKTICLMKCKKKVIITYAFIKRSFLDIRSNEFYCFGCNNDN